MSVQVQQIALVNVAELIAKHVVRKLHEMPDNETNVDDASVTWFDKCISEAVKSTLSELTVKVNVSNPVVSIYIDGLALDTHYEVGKKG